MTITISRNCNEFFISESEEETYVYFGLQSSFYNYYITYLYVHVSVHVVVGMLWHCEGAPPHFKHAIWEQGKTCKYYHEIRLYDSTTHKMYNNSLFKRAHGSLVHINEINKA